MSDHAINAVGFGTLGAGLFGTVTNYLQFFTLSNLSGFMSGVGIVVSAGLLIYQKWKSSRRKDHSEQLATDSMDLNPLLAVNTLLVAKVAELSAQILDLQHELIVARQAVDAQPGEH